MVGLVTESQENNAEEQKSCKIDKPSFKVCVTRQISQNCSLSRGPLQIGQNTNYRFCLILWLISQQEVFGGIFPLLKLQQIHIFYLPPGGKFGTLLLIEAGFAEIKKINHLCVGLCRSHLATKSSLVPGLQSRHLGNTKLISLSSLCNDYPPRVPSVDQPLVIYIIPEIYTPCISSPRYHVI